VFGDREPISHAGDVIRDGSRPRRPISFRRPFGGHGGWIGHIGLEQAPYDRVGLFANLFYVRMPVHAGDEKGLDVPIGRLDGGGLPDKRPPGGSDRLRTVDLRFGDPPPALANRVLDKPGDHATRQLMNRPRRLKPGIEIVDLSHQALDEWRGGAKLGERKQTGAQAVVDVVRVIGDIIRDRSRLRLEARIEAQVQRLLLIVSKNRCRNATRPVALSWGAGSVEQRSIVLDEPRQRRLGQVEAVERGIVALEFGDDAQSVTVMVEAAMLGHTGVERVLTGMPEGRMAEIVAKRDRFGQIVVEPQGPGDRARDLRHLDGVGEAGAEMVALVMDEHLGLVGETAEGGRMDDAVAIPLEFGPGRRRRLGDKASGRPRGVGCVGGASRVRGVPDHQSLRHCALCSASISWSVQNLMAPARRCKRLKAKVMNEAVSPTLEGVTISASAARRLNVILKGDQSAALRISVKGGGCSGFQYSFDVDRSRAEDDVAVTRDGATVLVDPVSLEMLKGAELDFVDDLMGQSFRVKNPNAVASCGCGVSFTV
jgi:iron-sulfur cluster insertion protein